MIELVQALADTWTSIADLGESLSEADWKRPSGCPGWTVQDNVSHLIDYESFALGRPRPDHTVGDAGHLKNDMGRMNEIGVDVRRTRTGAEVLAEFRDVTDERLARLRSVTESKLDEEAQTPIGPGTVRDLLTLRVMDSWSHEQDIRRALGRPGHEGGRAAGITVAYLGQFIGVARRRGGVEGAVRFVIGEGPTITKGEGDPVVTLHMDAPTFVALCGGRADAPAADVRVDGDAAAGERVIANMGFLP